MIQTLLQNWKRFEQANPAVLEAIRKGYEVGAYDQEAQMIMSREFVNGEIKIWVIEDGHVIPRADAAPVTINELIAAAHAKAVSKSWWDEQRSFGEIIGLIHSEAFEALEDYRAVRAHRCRDPRVRHLRSVWHRPGAGDRREDGVQRDAAAPARRKGVVTGRAEAIYVLQNSVKKIIWSPRIIGSTTVSTLKILQSKSLLINSALRISQKTKFIKVRPIQIITRSKTEPV